MYNVIVADDEKNIRVFRLFWKKNKKKEAACQER